LSAALSVQPAIKKEVKVTQSLVPFTPTELSDAWGRMSMTRKVGLAALAIAAVVGVVVFATWSSSPDYMPAFTDLAPKDGAQVVQYLKDNNISYRLTDGGGTVLVPSDKVYDVRLGLAGEGIPSQGTVGFEIFDTASIGMTDFLQQVDYQRALEGELARTISSLTVVSSARVHIVIPEPSLFTDEQQPATASVMVELEPGQRLSQEQVTAISNLVASAVEGLTTDNLTVVDMDGNVLAGGASDSAGAASLTLTTNQLQTQRGFERDMELRIKSMLEGLLGPGKAIVGVTADMNWDRVETENETFSPAPDGNVLRSSMVISESYVGGGTGAGGIPGTASNIPLAAPSYETSITGTNSSAYVRTEETTNYEISRSVSHISPATGLVERLSISVLVDNITNTTTFSAIEPAVIAAAGVDFVRGDVVTVSNVTFDRSYYEEQTTAADAVRQQEFILQLVKWGAIAVAIVAMFLVVRGIQRSLRPQPAVQALEAAASERSAELVDARSALLQELERQDETAAFDFPDLQTIGPPPELSADQRAAAERAQMVRQLQTMVKNRPGTVAQIIQFWLDEDKK
jgi:flagellar M-ring protein FliF